MKPAWALRLRGLLTAAGVVLAAGALAAFILQYTVKGVLLGRDQGFISELSGGRIELLVIVALVLVAVGYFLRLVLENAGVVNPDETWHDWRDEPCDLDESPRQQGSSGHEGERLLEAGPTWTHRGIIRSRRFPGARCHWGLIRLRKP